MRKYNTEIRRDNVYAMNRYTIRQNAYDRTLPTISPLLRRTAPSTEDHSQKSDHGGSIEVANRGHAQVLNTQDEKNNP